ncbi:MAG: PQQ-dependent sugar dehydrogenase [Alphaproteobacteria bacterium]|uniref:PQQ-dependent sugar dehydrogenase n=1 Tax=Candidatus Nitrobium versatile TaxID=2884831 RepID=A0A953JCD0_9BACT|nr:PQQ-dependent sugar dehydrogenase [Candidatus Nitrobium versatile]
MSTVCFLCLFLLCWSAAKGFPEEVGPPREWPKISFALKAGGVLAPTHIATAGDGSGRMFVTEQRGRIRIIKDNTLLNTPFLDISGKVSCCGERGLLSVAFPPGYSAKKYFYVNYTDRSGDTVIARYRVSSHPDVADPASEKILLTIGQPYANHNGGLVAFGPDGYLYTGMGDGGSAGDPHNNGQNPGSLLGKMLRIDVESATLPYGIPSNNPHINTKGYRPEIWAMGMRNPWRFSFDKKTGDLYIADVGQELYEEVNFQPAGSNGGENYGWNIMEGMHCFREKKCDTAGRVTPVAEYDHTEGCSITGGMVYRGMEFPGMQGVYLFADYCSGRLWGLRFAGGKWQKAALADTGYAVSTFGEDEAGNIYLADHREGNIYRIEEIRQASPNR